VTALLASLEDIGRLDTHLVGGKAAGLGELMRSGFLIPPGFVVTTSAFRLAAAQFDRAGAIAEELAGLSADDHEAVAAVTAGIRDRIEQTPVPEALRDVVVARYGLLGNESTGHDAGVAVRSSATGEDGLEASFAGVQDTYLWVRGADAVLSKVRACWASLYSVESVCYRLRLAIPEGAAAMAVVVQTMVDARSSGVMFTRSPSSGDRSLVAVESAWGLGSAVVGGEVTPDSFLLSKVTGQVLRRQVSVKHCRHVPNPARDGVLEEDVPAELQSAPSLSDEELGRLLELARAAEDHYGVAQDVEWAIAKGLGPPQDLLLLQSRPETAWSRQDAVAIATPKPRAFDHVIEVLGGR
jgi:pyruvate, water dikinase